MAVKLKINSEYSDRGLKRAKGDIGSFGSYAGGVFRRLGGLVAGFFAFRSISRFVKSSISAFFTQEKATRELEQALISAGVSADDYLPRLSKVASALQVITRVGDETIMSVMALGSSMGIHADNLDEAAAAAVAFNKRFGVDTRTAMKGVAMAFSGNTAQLGRYIPQLRGVTSAQDAYNIINATTNRLLREQSEVSMTNFGRVEAIKAAWGDLTEKFGEFLVTGDGVGGILDELLFTLEDIQSVGLKKWFEDTFPAMDAFIDRIGQIINGLMQFGEVKKDFAEQTAREIQTGITGTTGLREQDINIGRGGVGKGPDSKENIKVPPTADVKAAPTPPEITADVKAAPTPPEIMVPPAPTKAGEGPDSKKDIKVVSPPFGEAVPAPSEIMVPPAPTKAQSRDARRATLLRERLERMAKARNALAAEAGGLVPVENKSTTRDSSKMLQVGDLFARAFGQMGEKEVQKVYVVNADEIEAGSLGE